MKRNILVILFFSMMTFYGFSQSLVLIDSVAGELANGATIYKSGVNSTSGEIVQYMAVKNISGNDAAVMVKKTAVDTVPGTYNLFCWGLCFGPETYVSPEPLTVQTGTTNWLDFSGHYTPIGIAGATTVRYTFFIDRNPDDSVCVNVIFMAFPLGTPETESRHASISDAYPNPAKDIVSFNVTLSEGANGNLIIRNLLGSKIREMALTPATGKVTVPVSDLQEGVYFCTFEMNGTALMTKKMIVRR